MAKRLSGGANGLWWKDGCCPSTLLVPIRQTKILLLTIFVNVLETPFSRQYTPPPCPSLVPAYPDELTFGLHPGGNYIHPFRPPQCRSKRWEQESSSTCAVRLYVFDNKHRSTLCIPLIKYSIRMYKRVASVRTTCLLQTTSLECGA